jgi:hypothetical protein
VQAYVEALRRGEDRAKADHERSASSQGPEAAEVARFQAAEVRALCEALEPPDAPGRGTVWTIQTIIDTVSDEEWFVQIRNWRASEFGAANAWYLYLDGHDWTLTPAALPRHIRTMTHPPRTISIADESGSAVQPVPATIDLRVRLSSGVAPL